MTPVAMKRYLALTAFTLTFVGLVSAHNSKALSPMVHDAWKKSEGKAVNLADQGDYNHALALLSGGFYDKGVTIALNESSLGTNSVKAHNAFTRATQYWQNALGSDCPLKIVDPKDNPSAVVNLVDTIPGDGEELGLIEIKKNYQWSSNTYICKTNAKISIMRSFDSTALSEDETTEVMAHEIGHLLGLADLDAPGFLMGPMDRDHLTHGPTASEVEAVKGMRHDFEEEFDSILKMSHTRQTP